MQQSKSTEKQGDANGETAVYESRRLDAVRKNFAFGLQKESKSPVSAGSTFHITNQPNRN